MSKLNVFIATPKRPYENNYKSVNKTKSLCQLQIKRDLWRPAWFLYATSIRANCNGHNNAVLLPGDHGFINPVRLSKPVGNLHQS